MFARYDDEAAHLVDDKLITSIELYEGCGNVLSIVCLAQNLWKTDFVANESLRKTLFKLGSILNVDSVMVLTGDPLELSTQGYHCTMDNFDPPGHDASGMPGSWATMCGNGVRATVQYWLDQARKLAVADPRWRNFLSDIDAEFRFQIGTKSGVRSIEILSDHLFKVKMGEFTTRSNDLSEYVNCDQLQVANATELIGVSIPDHIQTALCEIVDVRSWTIGFTGDRSREGAIDGEPQAVLILNADAVNDLKHLRKLATLVGPLITKAGGVFPQEINANFVVIQELDESEKIVHVLACTHERGLGEDPAHCVTQSCGTGSTAIGAALFRIMKLNESWKVAVQTPGGQLLIEKEDGNFYMSGPANKCESFRFSASDIPLVSRNIQ